MPTRKQRRRRAKERRHEYEEVLVYPDGREVPIAEAEEELEDESEPEPAPARSRSATKPRPTARKPADGKRGSARTTTGRTVQPPSWRRVLKRAAIFAPLMFLFISVTSKGLTPAERVLVTAQMLLILIPFMYVMDLLLYRVYRKRVERAGG